MNDAAAPYYAAHGVFAPNSRHLDGFNGECNLCRRPATPTRIECEWAGWMLFADHVLVDLIVRECQP